MSQISPSSNINNSGPSLFKLVGAVPDEQRVRLPADALVIIGHQLELVVQEHRLAADVAVGTLRFSLFRLHQGRISQLANRCRSITVYGEADVEPPHIPGVQFVALQPGSALCHEWFLVVDSPGFWGALLTQAVPDRRNGNLRRYLFEGALTNNERIVSRTNLLLSLIQRSSAPEIGTRDRFANRIQWGRISYALAAHSEAERLALTSSLGEFPELLEIVSWRTRAIEQVLPHAMQALRRHTGTAGEIVYRYEGQRLHPLVWEGMHPPTIDLQDEGGFDGATSGRRGRSVNLASRALRSGEVMSGVLAPHEPEARLFPDAQSLVAVPLMVRGAPWGVMLVGLPDHEAYESSAALAAVGVGSLLEQILTARTPTTVGKAATNGVSVAALANGQHSGVLTARGEIESRMGSLNSPLPVAPNQPFANPPVQTARPFDDMDDMDDDMLPLYTPNAPATPAPMPQMPDEGVPEVEPAAGFVRGAAPLPRANQEPVAPPAPAAPAPVAGTKSGFGLPSWMRNGAGTKLPTTNNTQASQPPEMQSDRSWAVLQKRMMGALVAFDQRSAEQVWSEACSMYATESVCTELLMPVQVAIGEGWHRGEVSVAAEHFSSRFVQGKLLNLLNAYVDTPGEPLAVIGCAQSEMHEFGAIVLSLFMRWSGFRVLYLGQNVPNTTIAETIRQLRPQVLGLSATTIEAAHNLTEVGQIVTRIEPPRPQFIFGGMAFYERPDLRGRIQGQFLEGDVRQIVRQLAEHFRR